jgi:hypothetical protein
LVILSIQYCFRDLSCLSFKLFIERHWENSWRWMMMGVEAFCYNIYISGLFIPKSPRWLLSKF